MTSSRRSGVPMQCGHDAHEVSPERCWPCHLERLKKLQDAGRLSWDRLATSLVAAYEEL